MRFLPHCMKSTVSKTAMCWTCWPTTSLSKWPAIWLLLDYRDRREGGRGGEGETGSCHPTSPSPPFPPSPTFMHWMK